MKAYRIRSGAAFVMPDGSRRGAGALIELDDDVARDHAEKLEPDAPAEAATAQDPQADGTPPALPEPERKARRGN